MLSSDTPPMILGGLTIISSLGVLLLKKPVYACLSFLFSLICLALIYLHLMAPFIAVMQVLIYAGAILVLFIFVVVLFQDAHSQIVNYQTFKISQWLVLPGLLFISALTYLGMHSNKLAFNESLPKGYGSAEYLGKALYLDFSFPFEVASVLFLVAMVGALYIGKR